MGEASHLGSSHWAIRMDATGGKTSGKTTRLGCFWNMFGYSRLNRLYSSKFGAGFGDVSISSSELIENIEVQGLLVKSQRKNPKAGWSQAAKMMVDD